jgi:hypothetical protein
MTREISVGQPLSILVALIGSTVSDVKSATKRFRLKTPGIGPAYLVALDASPGGKIIAPSELPSGQITLWICLDAAAYDEATNRHLLDQKTAGYHRSFYDELLPQACILVEDWRENPQVLEMWVDSITTAWYGSS